MALPRPRLKVGDGVEGERETSTVVADLVGGEGGRGRITDVEGGGSSPTTSLRLLDPKDWLESLSPLFRGGALGKMSLEAFAG